MLSKTARAVIYPKRPKVTNLPRLRGLPSHCGPPRAWKYQGQRSHLFVYGAFAKFKGTKAPLIGPEPPHGVPRYAGVRTRLRKTGPNAGKRTAIKNRDGTDKMFWRMIYTTPRHCPGCWINRLEAYTRGE